MYFPMRLHYYTTAHSTVTGHPFQPISHSAFLLRRDSSILFIAENRSRAGLSTTQLALIIALGMGFQNLTEGLVFGALGATIGLTGTTLVVLVGFVFQNITEGFPIASPFLGRT